VARLGQRKVTREVWASSVGWCRTPGGLARPFGPDGNWAGARKEKEKGACDGLGQIDSRAGIEAKRMWVAEMAFKFYSRFFYLNQRVFKYLQFKFLNWISKCNKIKLTFEYFSSLEIWNFI
jgi:hypothetical protein